MLSRLRRVVIRVAQPQGSARWRMQVIENMIARNGVEAPDLFQGRIPRSRRCRRLITTSIPQKYFDLYIIRHA